MRSLSFNFDLGIKNPTYVPTANFVKSRNCGRLFWSITARTKEPATVTNITTAGTWSLERNFLDNIDQAFELLHLIALQASAWNLVSDRLSRWVICGWNEDEFQFWRLRWSATVFWLSYDRAIALLFFRRNKTSKKSFNPQLLGSKSISRRVRNHSPTSWKVFYR